MYPPPPLPGKEDICAIYAESLELTMTTGGWVSGWGCARGLRVIYSTASPPSLSPSSAAGIIVWTLPALEVSGRRPHPSHGEGRGVDVLRHTFLGRIPCKNTGRGDARRQSRSCKNRSG
ncbi:unnamed protein product, partial [Pylaiella littoralis]